MGNVIQLDVYRDMKEAEDENEDKAARLDKYKKKQEKIKKDRADRNKDITRDLWKR